MFAFDIVDKHLPAPVPISKINCAFDGETQGPLPSWEVEHEMPDVGLQGTNDLKRPPSKSTLDSAEAPPVAVTPLLTEQTPRYGTPPIRIVDASTGNRHVAKPPETAAFVSLGEQGTQRFPLTTSKAKSRRRKNKKGAKAAAPALNTVRGFTPAASGDEDSEMSSIGTPSGLTRRLMDLPSTGSSPLVRPSSACSHGGISALKLQLDTLNLDSDLGKGERAHRSKGPLSPQASSGADSSFGEASDGDRTPINTYEVPLEHDFISPDVSAKNQWGVGEGGITQDTMARKMTAADFEPLRCLGKGTYGTVLLVRQISTGRLFAQKQFRKASMVVNKYLVEQTKTERAILESINRHPFVVKLYYAFHDHEKLYLILEYAQGGELTTHLAAERMFTEDVAAFYMAEMVLALEHLHTNLGVVYRDLKPENILLDSEGHLLLTDFGLSKVPVDDNDHCKTIAGTDVYMAPEVILGKKYGSAVDWWSFGALGFDLLTGAPPFPGSNHARIKEKIVHGRLQLPYYLSADAKDLLTRLLRKEPSKRLGWDLTSDVQTIKKHRFFRKIDWKALETREVEPPITPMITDPELAENFSASFTDLAVSPVVSKIHGPAGFTAAGEMDPFGGFSFVASSSLLDRGW